MAGYGNQRQADPNFDGHDTKFDKHTDTNSYQGGHSVYKSGTVGGAGFGNKSNAEPNMEEYDNSDLRFESNHTEPYSGGHPEMKSGAVGGAGFGNKTGAWGNGEFFLEVEAERERANE